ncbi:MAG: hypothetical protein ACKVP0_14625 [Pirellulaceae bacterium]
MLKVNVGLSRKLSRDYNSTGFSVNLEGEITVPTNDSDGVIQQVKELFDLAEESLDQQIERTRSINAQANHDGEPERGPNNGQPRNGHAPNGHGTNGHNGRPSHDDRPVEPATNKQIQYLLSIGKRQRLSTNQLERQVQEILRREVGLYDLNKREAAQAIDALTGSAANGKAASRS